MREKKLEIGYCEASPFSAEDCLCLPGSQVSLETGGKIRGIHEARNGDDNPIHLTKRVLEHMGFLFLTSSILRNIGSTLQIALLEKHTNLFERRNAILRLFVWFKFH